MLFFFLKEALQLTWAPGFVANSCTFWDAASKEDHSYLSRPDLVPSFLEVLKAQEAILRNSITRPHFTYRYNSLK